MPRKSFFRVVGDSDIVARSICLAAQDVYDASLLATHSVARRMACAKTRPLAFSGKLERETGVTQSDNLRGSDMVQILRTGPPPLATITSELRRDSLRVWALAWSRGPRRTETRLAEP